MGLTVENCDVDECALRDACVVTGVPGCGRDSEVGIEIVGENPDLTAEDLELEPPEEVLLAQAAAQEALGVEVAEDLDVPSLTD